jgi:hypothetical protein
LALRSPSPAGRRAGLVALLAVALVYAAAIQPLNWNAIAHYALVLLLLMRSVGERIEPGPTPGSRSTSRGSSDLGPTARRRPPPGHGLHRARRGQTVARLVAFARAGRHGAGDCAAPGRPAVEPPARRGSGRGGRLGPVRRLRPARVRNRRRRRGDRGARPCGLPHPSGMQPIDELALVGAIPGVGALAAVRLSHRGVPAAPAPAATAGIPPTGSRSAPAP